MSNFHAIRTAVLISAFSITLAACSTPGDPLGDTAATTDASVTTTAPGARSPENGDTAISSVKSGAAKETYIKNCADNLNDCTNIFISHLLLFLSKFYCLPCNS